MNAQQQIVEWRSSAKLSLRSATTPQEYMNARSYIQKANELAGYGVAEATPNPAGDGWIGIIKVKGETYVRDYDIDAAYDDLTALEVFTDWYEDPSTFTQTGVQS